MVSDQVIFFPVYILTNNPILGSNIVLLLSFVLCGFGMFELVKYYTKNEWAAFIAGFIFAFSSFKFYHIAHLQLQTYQWMPFCVLYFDKFIDKQKSKDMLLFSLFFILQLLSSWYLGSYISILIASYLLFLILISERRKKVISKKFLSMLAVSIMIIFIITLPFIYPYYDLYNKLGIARTKNDVRYYSVELRDLFKLPSPSNLLYNQLNEIFHIGYSKWEKLVFPGFAVIAFTLFGLISTIKVRKGLWGIDFSKIQIFYFLLAVFSLIMCLGIQDNFYTPYEFFYDFLPGFRSMRVPARFFVLMIFSLSVLSGFGIRELLKQKERFRIENFGIATTAFLFVILFAETIWVPIHLETVPVGGSIPTVYKWLGTKEGNFAILELPMSNFSDISVEINARYMYFSTYHWKNIVNGYGSFFPYDYMKFVDNINDFPTNETLGYLEYIGVRYVILHREYYDNKTFERILSKIGQYNGRLTLLNISDDSVVFELLRSSTSFEFSRGGYKNNLFVMHLPESMKPQNNYTGALTVEDGYVFLDPLSTTIEIKYTDGVRAFHEDLKLKEHVLSKYSYSSFAFKSPPYNGEYNLTLKINGEPVGRYKFEVRDEVYDSVLYNKLNASISPQYENLSVDAGEWVEIPVTINNTGDTLWICKYGGKYYTKYNIALGWHLIDVYGASKEKRSILPFDVSPNETVRVVLAFQSPKTPGEYIIRLDMVDELVTWFNNSREISLTVRLSN